MFREKNQNQKKVASLKDLALQNKFPKVKVTIDGKLKEYSSILNWFDFQKEFNESGFSKIKFQCIICEKYVSGGDSLGKPGNQYKHFQIHKEGADWSRRFKHFQSETNSKP